MYTNHHHIDRVLILCPTNIYMMYFYHSSPKKSTIIFIPNNTFYLLGFLHFFVPTSEWCSCTFFQLYLPFCAEVTFILQYHKLPAEQSCSFKKSCQACWYFMYQIPFQSNVTNIATLYLFNLSFLYTRHSHTVVSSNHTIL